ncbi:MAG TPA: energy-coupling factor ABC transporter ATP-binding protein, partial [Erysipelothrix sp.]|nr:energy-coupling factor ABC transporter ATP-binding protein [Erysipelothrix sp.]
KGKKDVNDLIDEIHQKHQTTILSITHDIEEVNKSDYVLVMNDGEIVFAGSPQDILTLKKQLVAISLDVPFSVNFALELEKNGLKVSNPLDEERMVEDLWQLYSKI